MKWVEQFVEWMDRLTVRLEARRRWMHEDSELRIEIARIKTEEEIRRIELAGQRIRMRRAVELTKENRAG